MASLTMNSFTNIIRDQFYDFWSNVWDNVLEKTWKTRNLPKASKEFQRALFEMSIDGEKILESEKLEKLPALFYATDSLDKEFKASSEMKKQLSIIRKDFIRWLAKRSAEQGEFEFLKTLLQSFQDPKLALEFDLEEFETPSNSKAYRFRILPKKDLAKLILRLRKGWMVLPRHDDEIMKTKVKIREENQEKTVEADVETEIDITGESINKIYALIEQLYMQLPQRYPDLFQENNVVETLAWIPCKIEKRNEKEYLKLKLVRVQGANVLLTLIPVRRLFEKFLDAMDLYILGKLWLSPVSRTLPLGPVGPWQEVDHWFNKSKDVPSEAQVTVPEAINSFLGTKVFDENNITRDQLANLADYFVASKVPLLFLRIDKSILDAALELYATKGYITIESQELKIKPVQVKFEKEEKKDQNKDKKEEKIYRIVSEGKEMTPEFVADASLDKKKMIMYKITFKLANGSEKRFFLLRLTGAGKRDTVYIGKLQEESLSEQSSQNQ
jgi:hypothetical protein